jgi:Domain of Unknown Function (DUF748)
VGRYRRHLIILAVVVVLVGLYALLGFLAVPHFARKGAEDFVRQHYGRTLSIGEIHFNPFNFDLDIVRLSLPDADGQPMLAFQRLHVDLELATLWRFAPSFREILLEQPYVRAVLRPGGELNLADLGKGFPPAPPQQQPKKSAPMRLYIERLAVLSGTTTFEDRTRAPPFRAEFKPIAFELRDFSTTARTGNDYSLQASSPEGERLTWDGTVELAPLASRGNFEIADLKARTIWNYLRDTLPFELDTGVIGIKGEYQLTSTGGAPSLGVDVHAITLQGLGLKPRGGAEHYADVAHVEVDETRIDLSRHSVQVGKVLVSGGDIKSWVTPDGHVNLMDMLNPPASAAAPAAPAPAPPPAPPAKQAAAGPAWTVSAPEIALSGFKISAEDRRLQPAGVLLLQPLNLHVTGFNSSPQDAVDVTLDTGVNGAGKLAARAHAPVHGGALSAHLESSDLPLTMLQPYIGHYTSMTLLKGTLGLRADVQRDAAGALAVKADTSVADLRTIDNALKQDFIKWRALRVADIRFRSQPQSLRIGSITAIEPYARVIVAPNRTLNITEILTAPGAAPQVSGAPPAAADSAAVAKPRSARGKHTAPTASAPAKPLTPFPMSIGAVRFANGSVNYADLWIKPSFAVGIQTLDGSVTGLSSDPASRAKVELNGKLEQYSPVHIGGSVNLLSAALFTDITMSFKDIDLTIVNPYSSHFVGYRINKGKLSVDVTYQINQRALDAKQHFVVDQLELGDEVASPDAVHLPLRLAVALLRDRNGVIDLDLPMNGSLDDPQFRIGPIIWKVFVNLIVKAATAPFALIGHLFGGGEHVNVVEFAPGSADLAKPAQEQLTSIANALKERPQLKLDVPMVASVQQDAPHMSEARLHAELVARVMDSHQGKKHPDTAAEAAFADPKTHFRLLLEQYQADLGKDAQLPPSAIAVQQAKSKDAAYDAAINDLQSALVAHLTVGDADLQALGKARAQAIQDALVSAGQIEPERIFIVNAPPQTQPGQGDTVKVELAVK